MSKELTPFQALTEIAYVYGYDKNIEIIDNALEDYEKLKIENSEQFKEKWVQDNLAMTFELNVAKKYKKALHIIKNKKVDMKNLLGYFEWENGFSFYNEYLCEEEKLTQEEYEFLREVLLCGL